MKITIEFIITSIMLGVGLAMDAFSVSVANGLNEPKMKKNKMILIASVFAVFQAVMPMIGWICVHTIVSHFKAFERFIPWIALVLLLFIGGSMIKEALCKQTEEKDDVDSTENKEEKDKCKKLCVSLLLIQGIATSIDALSVGFTIAKYGFGMALLCAVIIAIVTFIICMAGVVVGKKVGIKYSDKASIFGGVILIIIGLEIFLTGVVL